LIFRADEHAFAAKATPKAALAAIPAGPPKRPLNAYMLFAKQERPALQQKFPGSVTEVAKALGAAWTAADQKTRTKWEQAAGKEKTKYEAELQAFLASGGVVPPRKVKNATKPKVERAPRAPSAYNLFLKDSFSAEKAKPANKNAKASEVMKMVAAQWSALAPSNKKKFEDAAAKAKAELQR